MTQSRSSSMRCRSAQTTHLSADMGIYAQDKWTYKRATINAGVRFDYFKNNFPEQHLGPARLVADRNVTIPAVDYANMKDITPRVGSRTTSSATGRRRSGALGQVRRSASSPTRATRSRSSPTSRTGAGRRSLARSDAELLHRRSATCRTRRRTATAARLDNALFGQLTPSARSIPRPTRGGGIAAGTRNSPPASSTKSCRAFPWTSAISAAGIGNFTVVDNRAVGPTDFTTLQHHRAGRSRLALCGTVISGLHDKPARRARRQLHDVCRQPTATVSSTGTASTSPSTRGRARASCCKVD